MHAKVFWAIVGGCIGGIWLRGVLPLDYAAVAALFVAATAILAAAYVARERLQTAVIAAVFLAACGIGIARFHAGVLQSDALVDSYVGEKVRIEGIVQDEPDVRENNVRIPVRVTSIASSSIDQAIGVLVIAPLHTDVAYGDVVAAEGVLKAPESFETGPGRVFDYPAFLAKDGIAYQMSYAEVAGIGDNEGAILKSWAISIKHAYLRGLANALPEPQAGLAGGITVGDKRGLGEELSETFRTVGLTHIVVLSGYNIMVVMDALMRSMARAPSAVRLSAGAIVALFFAAITGFASASTRAAGMAMIAIVGKATRRMYLASRALAFVALAMVLWNPYVLMFDPGFQLSVIATIGLIVIAPRVNEYLAFMPERFGLREILATTLGTQAAVLPLLLYQNGQLALFALPTNLFALVVIPWAMLVSALAAVVGIVFESIAPFAGVPALALLSYVIGVARAWASLPFASLTIPAFGVSWLFIAYAFLIIWAIKKERRSQ